MHYWAKAIDQGRITCLWVGARICIFRYTGQKSGIYAPGIWPCIHWIFGTKTVHNSTKIFTYTISIFALEKILKISENYLSTHKVRIFTYFKNSISMTQPVVKSNWFCKQPPSDLNSHHVFMCTNIGTWTPRWPQYYRGTWIPWTNGGNESWTNWRKDRQIIGTARSATSQDPTTQFKVWKYELTLINLIYMLNHKIN